MLHALIKSIELFLFHSPYKHCFTFNHLAEALIQSDLQIMTSNQNQHKQ